MPLIRPFVTQAQKEEFQAFQRERKAKARAQLQAEIKAESKRIQAAKQEPKATKTKTLVARVTGSLPLRVFKYFGAHEGQLLASGLSYQAVFALFASLWFTFSVLGIVASGNKQLSGYIVQGVNGFVPGLIGGSDSAVSLDQLLTPQTLGWSSAISLLAVLFTAVGFLGTLRGAVLSIFERHTPAENFVIRKGKDLVLLILFGLLLLLSVAASVITAAAAGFVFDLLGLPTNSFWVAATSSALGLIVAVLLDTVLVAGVVRVLAGVKAKHLWRVALATGAVLGFLQTLGSGLLGAPKDNPLFASFAVLFGILVYFNFVCQILLFGVSWLRVSQPISGPDKAPDLTLTDEK